MSTGLYGAKLAGFGVGHTGTGVILGLIPFIVVFLASALAFPSKGE
ncbi:galactokinase [Moorella thermoacetica Y72]|uniref:Galactokinase n=1 Tax=Moorella thermoacetica Y72 TaxID=1325331 RepID=A0A0S6UD87_NEOTH|nr:galactokinase [Moorella thermoacetica Y72]